MLLSGWWSRRGSVTIIVDRIATSLWVVRVRRGLKFDSTLLSAKVSLVTIAIPVVCLICWRRVNWWIVRIAAVWCGVVLVVVVWSWATRVLGGRMA